MTRFRAINKTTGLIIHVIDVGDEFFVGAPAMAPMTDGMRLEVFAFKKSEFDRITELVWRDVTGEYDLSPTIEQGSIFVHVGTAHYGLLCGDRIRKVESTTGPYFIIERLEAA